VTYTGAAVHRRVSVRGSGGVTATVVVVARRGWVMMSIDPPFTWETIMDSENVDELIRTLGLAQSDAKKMPLAPKKPASGS
jgi:hypothetical protein